MLFVICWGRSKEDCSEEVIINRRLMVVRFRGVSGEGEGVGRWLV